MNISLLHALPIGNAVELLLTTTADTVLLRLLRRTDRAFAGPDDPAATVIYNAAGSFPCSGPSLECALSVLDTQDIVNGVPLFYQAYALNGTQWVASSIETITSANIISFLLISTNGRKFL